jgi:hypothetical protein
VKSTATQLGRVLALALALSGASCSKKAAAPPGGGDTAGAGGADVGAGGGGGNAGSADAGADDRLLPLASGRRWTFKVSGVGDASAQCPPGMTTATVLSESTESGQPAFAYHPICSDADFVLVGAGDKLQAHPLTALDPSFVYLDTPVEEGHSWQDAAGRTLTWHRTGTVTVPAGTYTDCWDRQLASPAENGAVTFCRGIGQVRYAFSTYTAELVDKSF